MICNRLIERRLKFLFLADNLRGGSTFNRYIEEERPKTIYLRKIA